MDNNVSMDGGNIINRGYHKISLVIFMELKTMQIEICKQGCE